MPFLGGSSWQDSSPKTARLPRCGKCGLAKGCYSPRMAPSGRGSRSLYFLAEAPGEEEDRQGVQLIGKSGQRLRKSLSGATGVDLDDCTKDNAVRCRPPGNETTPVHIDSCRPSVLKSIRETKPSVIILLGGSAARSVITMEREDKVGKVERWVGWTIPSQEFGAWICPTYHPAFLLRSDEDPVLVRMFERHLKKAVSLEKKRLPSVSLGSLKEQIELIFSPRLARKRIRDLSKKKGFLAFDYEATGLKPEDPRQRILSCSFCLNGEDTFACVINESVQTVLSRVLRSERLAKIASNLKFEERWTRRKLGHPVANWYWDTMTQAHVIDNRPDITGLKFQAYIHFGVANYDKFVEPFKEVNEEGFNRLDQMNTRDLLEYNGLDSLLEYMVMEKQKEILGR